MHSKSAENNSSQKHASHPRRAEWARRSLYIFIKEGWHVLEPDTVFIDSWHIRAIADEVQKLLEGTAPDWKQNLLVNVPPGSMKSLIVSVFGPVWYWLHRPSWKAIFLSANPRVAVRDSLKRRRLLESDWYQQSFRPEWQMSSDQDAKLLFQNTATGAMQAQGIGGSITGERVDGIFVDDPLDAADAHSKVARTAVIDAWTTAIRNRLSSMTRGIRCIIMQRLHETDLSGYVLETEPVAWEHVMFPSQFEPERADRRDKRTARGDLLDGVRFPEPVLKDELTNLGTAGFAGQHQQRPAPAGGNRFERVWWRFYRIARNSGDHDTTPRQRPNGSNNLPTVVLPYDYRFPETVQSWDMTFKDTDGSDNVAGAVVSRDGARKFVRYMSLAKRSFTESCKEVIRVSALYPDSYEKLVENKANGPAIVNMLSSKVSGLIERNPEGGKEARAASMEPGVEAGDWLLPEGEPWVDAFIEEFSLFPLGKNDDQVDAMSQAAIRFLESEGDKALFEW